MPTYEYECTACGNRVEVFQRIAEEPLATCERCGGALRKLFHPVGISFKGSGFYTTDSRKVSKNGEPKKKPKKQETASGSSSGADTPKKSPEKPAEKPTEKSA